VVLKTYTDEREVGNTKEHLSEYVENIENDVSEIKFFLSQIYKAFTIYKDKKEEFKAEVNSLNEVIADYKDREQKYQQEIETLNKTINSIRDKEKKHFEQIKQLEKTLIEYSEKQAHSQNFILNERNALPRNNRNSTPPSPNTAHINSPNIFYEKRPYYNELNVSKVIDPFKSYRA
jgi:chromosome segregation ATPase